MRFSLFLHMSDILLLNLCEFHSICKSLKPSSGGNLTSGSLLKCKEVFIIYAAKVIKCKVFVRFYFWRHKLTDRSRCSLLCRSGKKKL